MQANASKQTSKADNKADKQADKQSRRASKLDRRPSRRFGFRFGGVETSALMPGADARMRWPKESQMSGTRGKVEDRRGFVLEYGARRIAGRIVGKI